MVSIRRATAGIADRDNESALREDHSNEAPGLSVECLFEIHFEFLYVGLSWQRRSIEFLEGFGDALGLRAEKPRSSSFLTTPAVSITKVCIDRQCTTSWVASKSLLAVGFVFANSLPAMAATPDSNISLQRFDTHEPLVREQAAVDCTSARQTRDVVR